MDEPNFFDVDEEAGAQQLVGKFLQSFALMEQSLDLRIAKLLDLEGGKSAIVCSNMAFAKKVDVFFSAEGLLAKRPDENRKTALRNSRSRLRTH